MILYIFLIVDFEFCPRPVLVRNYCILLYLTKPYWHGLDANYSSNKTTIRELLILIINIIYEIWLIVENAFLRECGCYRLSADQRKPCHKFVEYFAIKYK